MREWKYRRIISEEPSCTLCPCKMGLCSQVWLQSTVSLWHRAPCAFILHLGNFFPRFSFFLTVSSWSTISAFPDILHKLQAPSSLPNSHLWGFLFACWYFLCLFALEVFLPAETGSLCNHFPPELSYQIHNSSLPEDSTWYRHPLLLKGTGQENQEQMEEITHQRIYMKL